VPVIRKAGGDVLVKSRVDEIIVESNRAAGVRLSNGDEIRSRQGVVSDAGYWSTLTQLLPRRLVEDGGPLAGLYEAVNRSSSGISHVFAFIGLNASNEELGLRSSSYYYTPWYNTTKDMDATAIQNFFRDTLLDPVS